MPTQPSPLKIDVHHLSFAYAGGGAIFEDFSWKVAPGDAWAIIGPSGCGKSTLLYLLAGLMHPAWGTITIDGAPLTRPRPKTGLVLQDHGLLPWATVAQNARLGLTVWQFYGTGDRHAPPDAPMENAAIDALVSHWLQRLGIAALRGQYPGQLSRGQRQRTALARTLVLQPDLLLLDEPFSALDAPTREDLRQLMDALLAETGLTRVVVTHDIDEALLMGRRILVLGGGRPQVVDNPCSQTPEDAAPDEFRRLRQQLRDLLGERV
jgi:ABC-type nitrate/sulfonate/bicarbonate transport system ATPase subunit